MASVVTRASAPTAVQYVSGERDSTRKRTDALLHRHGSCEGEALRSLKRLSGQRAGIQGFSAVTGAVDRDLRYGPEQQPSQPVEVVVEDLEDDLHGDGLDPVDALEAGVVVGDEADVAVTHAQLPGEDGLG